MILRFLKCRIIMLKSYLRSLFLYCIWKQSVALSCCSELASASSACLKAKFFYWTLTAKQNGLWGRKEEEEEVEGGGKSTLKYSSCAPRTIGRVWWERRNAVIVGVLQWKWNHVRRVKLQLGTEEVWALCTRRLGTWNKTELYSSLSSSSGFILKLFSSSSLLFIRFSWYYCCCINFNSIVKTPGLSFRELKSTNKSLIFNECDNHNRW